MNQAYATGPGKSLKVCPGDNVDVSVSTYFEGGNGYGSSNNSMATMVASIATAFGGVSGGTGESGLIYNGVNRALSVFGLGANLGDSRPSAYLNYILFDQQYRVVNMGWKAVPSSAYFNKQTITLSTVKVKEAGYMFVYLTYETASNNFVYFDDFKVTHTKNNVVQYNEYYAHGLQTANSWTRDNNTGNNFLFNGGTELNSTTSVYDLQYRGYDPQLGRMNQVDPVASKYASQTPYNYALNSPTVINDPLGDDVYVSTALYNFVMNIFNRSGGNGGGRGSAGGSGSRIMDNGTAGGGRGSYGGTWNSQNGYRSFTSGSEALAYGMAYNDMHDSWRYTQYQSREGTMLAYLWATSTGSMPSRATVDDHLRSAGGRSSVAIKNMGSRVWAIESRAISAAARGAGPVPMTLYELQDPVQNQRPAWDLNGDGVLSLSEANNWYRTGGGVSITVDASKIDMRNVYPGLFTQNDAVVPVNFFWTGPGNVGVVYGSLDLVYEGNNRVSILPNRYDFDISDHPWLEGNFWRNVFTVLGGWNAGDGRPFWINFSGTAELTWDKKHDSFMNRGTGNY